MNDGDKEALKEQIKAIIKKTERSIKTSKRLFDDEDFDFAISRLYYADVEKNLAWHLLLPCLLLSSYNSCVVA